MAQRTGLNFTQWIQIDVVDEELLSFSQSTILLSLNKKTEVNRHIEDYEITE